MMTDSNSSSWSAVPCSCEIFTLSSSPLSTAASQMFLPITVSSDFDCSQTYPRQFTGRRLHSKYEVTTGIALFYLPYNNTGNSWFGAVWFRARGFIHWISYLSAKLIIYKLLFLQIAEIKCHILYRIKFHSQILGIDMWKEVMIILKI